jgi:hypothetical protein
LGLFWTLLTLGSDISSMIIVSDQYLYFHKTPFFWNPVKFPAKYPVADAEELGTISCLYCVES